VTYVDIVIPTRNRFAKLERMLRTIPREAAGKKINIKVICDDDPTTFAALQRRGGCDVYLTDKQKGAVYCRNLLIRSTKDALIYATDDIEFLSLAIDNAIGAMLARFHEDDGVVGFHQLGNSYNPAGVALVGKAFIDRYPQRALFNPAYFHFACQEIHRAAVKLGKFHLERTAVVKHWHPNFCRAELDKTHGEARSHRREDLELKAEREKQGLIWGIND
jgi:hypothetical protein